MPKNEKEVRKSLSEYVGSILDGEEFDVCWAGCRMTDKNGKVTVLSGRETDARKQVEKMLSEALEDRHDA